VLGSFDLSVLGVLVDQADPALHLFDAGDPGAHEVDSQLLGPDIEFLVALPAGPDVHVVDGDIRIGILFFDQLGILEGGHAADAGAVAIADRGISRSHALQEGDGAGDLSSAGPDHLSLGGAGGIEHPLHLQGGDHIPVPSEAVLLLSGCIEGLPAGGHDYGSHIDLEVLRLLLQPDCICRAGLGTAGASDAGLGIDAGGQGHGLGIGDIDGLSLAYAEVVLAGDLHGAGASALIDAALAQLLVHIAGPSHAGDGEVAHASLHTQHLGVGVEGDVGVVVDLGHLRPQDAYGAVVGGKDIGQQSHVAADGGPAFHQIDMKPGIGQVQGGGDPGHATSYDQDILAHRNAFWLKRLEQLRLGHSHSDEILGLLRGHGRLVHVHPGALLTDVGHLQHIGIQARLADSPAEGGLMEAGRAGRHHHPVQFVLGYVLLDLLLADVGAGELQVTGHGHAGERLSKALQVLHIEDPGYIQAAVTDVNTSGHGTSGEYECPSHLNLCHYDCYWLHFAWRIQSAFSR